jgi:peptidoglycan endopeptidase LytF
MSRRDVIILSVLINTGLLAILFVTAWQSDEGVKGAVITPLTPQVASTEAPGVLVAQNNEEIVIAEPQAVLDSTTLQEVLVSDENTVSATSKSESTSVAKASQSAYVEVTVKRGDYLGRIASANGVTVDAIMKANNLNSAQLQVGQVLKIPKGAKESKKESATSTASVTKETKSVPKDTKVLATADEAYYIIQRGDNPWSIARKFQISHEDLLKWNQLNEEGARNLQAGQRLRVRK